MQTSKFFKIVQNLAIFGKIARTPTEEKVDFWTPNKYSCYSQPRSRVNDIFEIWTEFWNLHVSFQNRQRDFRVPV